MSHPLSPRWLSRPQDANALHAGVWPESVQRLESGELAVGGVTATDLVATYGSPLYVVDEAELVRRAEQFRDIVTRACERNETAGSVYYASKSLITGHVAQWVSGAGLGFDVASGGEMAVALAAGVPAENLEFQGNNKSESEIRQALEAGVGCIVIDAPVEAERIDRLAAELGIVASVMVRVNTGVHAETHEYLATAREDQKFGLSVEETHVLIERIRGMSNMNFEGLHSHIGSQIFQVDGFLEAATRLMALYVRVVPEGERATLNLGGGFGIAYTAADQAGDITSIIDSIVDHVGVLAREAGVLVPHISFEPGRIISGHAGVTLYSVGVTKPVIVHADDGSEATRLYVSVDGGMSDNARTALYKATYSARLASRVSDVEPAHVRVVGKHCESGDVVVDAEYLPGDVEPGDILAVPATGAYCYSLSSNYNALGRPPMVSVKGGQHQLMIAGETVDDVLSRDLGITRHKGS